VTLKRNSESKERQKQVVRSDDLTLCRSPKQKIALNYKNICVTLLIWKKYTKGNQKRT